MNRSREEKPSASLWCYFFVMLTNDGRSRLFACFIRLKFLHFYSDNWALFETDIYCGQFQNDSLTLTH